ncbi:protein-L-isoaspartate O-methyltransferase [Rhodoferax sp. 4810]|uniref:Protein-L-isoaspartate O-methyltransferase n=1 Tax=Thiospirillum jenense TaxID=1653858 RepID=A0A839HDY1_9GAMM|nr:protein-L-isoaspartate O-methyltransferase [Thiospirillum jenense]MBB1075462.1 protein-L-isoaspartate O-methyltransferase [Rhodoferax jenense]MBB1126841.1 protein-L-isoaspartate O-methyltransferase [Thiospirillum jenense]
MTTNFEQMRFNMIEQQVRPWEVLDERVLNVLAAFPREDFVPADYRNLAYADIEIPLGDEQSMLPPRIVGRLLQALNVQPGEQVLEIGTGSGYVTACLAQLGGQVRSLDINPMLVDTAYSRLAAHELGWLSVQTADIFAADTPIIGAPFDAIAVTGSLPDETAVAYLIAQLTLGGRLFVVIGQAPLMQAWLITRLSNGDIQRQQLFETCIPPLCNVPQPGSFVF